MVVSGASAQRHARLRIVAAMLKSFTVEQGGRGSKRAISR